MKEIFYLEFLADRTFCITDAAGSASFWSNAASLIPPQTHIFLSFPRRSANTR